MMRAPDYVPSCMCCNAICRNRFSFLPFHVRTSLARGSATLIIIRIPLIAFGPSGTTANVHARYRHTDKLSTFVWSSMSSPCVFSLARPAIIVTRYRMYSCLNVIATAGVYQICYIAYGRNERHRCPRTHCKLNIFHFHLSVWTVRLMFFNATFTFISLRL